MTTAIPIARPAQRLRPRVAILGGGFAGLHTAKALRSAPVEVVVVDRQNHHLFQPLLYQVATAGLTGPNIASPIRKILRSQSNASVLYADATGFDLDARCVHTGGDAIDYDYLVVATGVTHSYFGHDEWAEHAPGLKTLADAGEIRTRVLRAFEQAELEADDDARAAWLTFVVVGGGPTGVELAGALAELARHSLPRDFRRFDPRRSRVILLEGAERVLTSYPDELSAKARTQLERLGVEVRTATMVTEIDALGVDIEHDGRAERVAARTVIWGAGVRGTPLLAQLGAELDRLGRVPVDPFLRVSGRSEVFVIGDAAAIECDGKPVPGVAPAAIQMGKLTARNIARELRGESPTPFAYRDKGSLATIGRAAAVADLGRLRFGGILAWWAWLLIHVMFLIGFRSRLVLLFEWSWSWWTYQRVARVFAAPARGRDER